MANYLLSAYRRDGLSYGGAEEGGWYYETGSLVRTLRVFHNEETAYVYLMRASRLMDRLQRDRRSVSSVMYDGSRYAFRVHTNVAPESYPQERPYYE